MRRSGTQTPSKLRLILVLVSLRFNGHFPCGPGLASTRTSPFWTLLEQRMMEVAVATGAISLAKLVKKSPPTNQHPVFLQAGCPSCHPTNSVKALNGKYHISRTCSPEAHLGGGFPTLYLSSNSFWLPWGRVAPPLISPLMPVTQS